MPESLPTPLTHFAPLIQLWAGICAICFYDTLIKSLVATEKRKRLRKNLAVLKELLHGSLDDEKHSIMNQKIDDRLFLFGRGVIHLGKLFCGLSVALLVIAALESDFEYQYIWLLIVLGLSCIYSILIIENKPRIFLIRPWRFMLPLLVGWFFLICGYLYSFSLEVNPHWICLVAVGLLVFPVVYLVIAFYKEERMAKFRWKLMQDLKKEFDSFVRIQSTGGRDFDSNAFSEELKNILAEAGDRDAKQKVFEEYIIKKLEDMFRYGSISFYKTHSFITICCRELREFWIVYKESLLIMIMCFGMYSIFIFGIYHFR